MAAAYCSLHASVCLLIISSFNCSCCSLFSRCSLQIDWYDKEDREDASVTVVGADHARLEGLYAAAAAAAGGGGVEPLDVLLEPGEFISSLRWGTCPASLGRVGLGW